MRHESWGTSGVSTETIRLLLRAVAWSMCFMSISMAVPFACGAAKRRDAAAKSAPRRKVFLKKSRLLFMVLPPLRVGESSVLQKLNGYGIQERCMATSSRCVGYAASSKETGRTQMRRMLKDALYTEGRSEEH